MAKKRFFPALLLTLVLALSPLSAFAESGAYAVKFYPGDYGTMTKNDQIPFVYLPEHEQHQQRHLPEHQWQCQQQQLHQHQRVPPRSDGKARPSRPKAKSSAIHHIKGGHIQP